MLHLIKSNRMELLMEALAGLLAQVPDDPMAAEWIGIQSRGMKQWITTCLARKFGVCANLTFMFPRQILEMALPDKGPGSAGLLERETLVWALMDLMLKDTGVSHIGADPGLKAYIKGDETGRKRLQLCRKIAQVFDDYQIYRPEMILEWEDGKRPPRYPDPAMAWQADLWKKVAGNSFHTARRIQAFLAEKSINPDGKKIPGLPPRICLFGVSAMPAGFLNVFSALAKTMDIYLFLLSPSNQFFFDIKSRRQIEKIAMDSHEAYYEIANPLLASLGRSGREFFDILEGFDYHEPFEDLFLDPRYVPGEPTLLSTLQSDVLNLVFRKPGSSDKPVPVSFDDRSISVHACHSPMREAQVLKDLLLEAFEGDPDLAPHDVVVMMPDIEAYAPFIQAVFSSEHKIPHTVSDRRRQCDSPTLEAFLKILQLKDSRFELARVLDLLACPAIGAKFDIPGQDLVAMEAALQDAGVLWGRDKDQRQAITGIGFDENTWEFGLRRLFMGYAMAEGADRLSGGVLPLDAFEGLSGEILGKLAHFCHTLFDRLREFETPGTISQWGEDFKKTVLTMMANEAGNEADMVFLLKAIDEFVQEGQRAGFTRKINFSLARDSIESKLGKTISQGSFMAGSLTFCNLMPMRSIPFKVVVLMGMDEKSYPRQTGSAGFDLMGKYPRKGDKQEREEDRYLFLESLLSARNRLIITYTGMSIKDNSPIPCAGPVEELKDVIEQSFEFPLGYTWQFIHPLHPFSPVYFAGNQGASKKKDTPTDTGFFSYSSSQCRIAMSQAGDMAGKFSGRFLDREFRLEPQSLKSPGMLLLSDLVAFFKNPVQRFIRTRIGLSYPEPGEQPPEREPFQVSGLTGYTLGSYYMDRAVSDTFLDIETAQDLYPLVRGTGQLPLGEKGKMEWERLRSIADPVADLARTCLPPGKASTLEVNKEFDLSGQTWQVTGSITDVYPKARFTAGFGRLTPARLLTQWIFHLFYQDACSTAGKECGPTCVLGQDPKFRKPAVAYTFHPVSNSSDLIRTLVSLYIEGQERMIPFFCNTCFSLAQGLARENFEVTELNLAKVMGQARRHWHDPFRGIGEGLDRYSALVFGDANPFDNPSTLKESGLVESALAVFKPLLENYTCK